MGSCQGRTRRGPTRSVFSISKEVGLRIGPTLERFLGMTCYIAATMPKYKVGDLWSAKIMSRRDSRPRPMTIVRMNTTRPSGTVTFSFPCSLPRRASLRRKSSTLRSAYSRKKANPDCDLYREKATCWEQVRKKLGVQSTQEPVCSGYQGVTTRWSSSVAYPVEVSLFPQPAAKTIDGPVKCWPVD